MAAGGNYVIPLVLCIFIAGVLFVSVFFQSVIYFLLPPSLRSSPSLVERSTTVEYFYVILSFFFPSSCGSSRVPDRGNRHKQEL